MSTQPDRFVVLEEVELYGYEGVFTVVIDQLDMTAVAKSHESEDDRKRVEYKLTKNHEELNEVERKNVLNYRLGEGNYNPKTEKVQLEDIFMHGHYLEKISEESIMQDEATATN